MTFSFYIEYFWSKGLTFCVQIVDSISLLVMFHCRLQAITALLLFVLVPHIAIVLLLNQHLYFFE